MNDIAHELPNEGKIEKCKRRKPIIALLLSWGAPGLGQVYNGQLKKGIILFLAFIVTSILFLATSLVYEFQGMIIGLLISIAFLLYIWGDALWNAHRRKEFKLKSYNKWYIYVVIIVSIYLFNSILISCSHTFIKTYIMPSASMQPTLLPGDFLIADMSYYKKHEPKAGDLVIFSNPKNDSVDIIKRIVGVEGQKIGILEKQLSVDDMQIEEPWAIHNDTRIIPRSFSPRDNFGPVIVPAGSVFVMGDNRDRSEDSRFFGFVDKKRIKGKPLYIYFSKDMNRIGLELQ
ncbi:signal peptidase I [bacterium]|nr:signal peptidase I [bacterium]